MQLRMVTSNKSYYTIIASGAMDADSYGTHHLSVVADMDASDTVLIQIYQSNEGAAQADVSSATYFSGLLVT